MNLLKQSVSMYTTQEVSCMLILITTDFTNSDLEDLILTSLHIGVVEYTRLTGEEDIIHHTTDLHTGVVDYTHLTIDLHITEEDITDRIIVHTIEITEIIITAKEVLLDLRMVV
jgi:hypothetical protein